MRAVTIHFDYQIQQSVTVKSLSVEGVITGLAYYLESAREYRVEYWYDGTRRVEWMHPWEIQDHLPTLPKPPDGWEG